MTKRITNRPLKPAGRKAIPYDEEIAAEICERIAQGEGLEEICEDPRLPCEMTVRKWMADQPTFMAAYARARAADGEVV